MINTTNNFPRYAREFPKSKKLQAGRMSINFTPPQRVTVPRNSTVRADLMVGWGKGGRGEDTFTLDSEAAWSRRARG